MFVLQKRKKAVVPASHHCRKQPPANCRAQGEALRFTACACWADPFRIALCPVAHALFCLFNGFPLFGKKLVYHSARQFRETATTPFSIFL